MHELQDSYVHYDKGYRAPLGHILDSNKEPDSIKKHRDEFDKANDATKKWEDKWDEKQCKKNS